jgi:hypothetical protein
MPRRAIVVVLATILAPLPQLTPPMLPILDEFGQQLRSRCCRLIKTTCSGNEDEFRPMILWKPINEHYACTADRYFRQAYMDCHVRGLRCAYMRLDRLL